MKKSIIMTACIFAGLSLSITSCQSTKKADKLVEATNQPAPAPETTAAPEAPAQVPDNTVPDRPVIIGMANPFTDCQTLEEAAAITGFSIELPSKEDIPQWADKIIYRASDVKTKLLEIIYNNTQETAEQGEEPKEIRIRKAITDKEDMSGDYRSYEKEETITAGNKTVTARINGDLIYVAIWRDGEYAYSLRDSQGLTKENLERYMEIIK